MRYLMDTNTFIAAMKGVAAVRDKLEHTPLSDLVLSPVVLGELELGIEKSAHREKNAARLAGVVARIELLPLDARVSRHYATIRADLERKGTPIGANDYWIAAQGLAFGAVVVTDNEAEFTRVPGLAVENWLRAAP
ncbi:PIN domain-containing protein [Candidatus Thiodictyon syntrophicum]|jgi:tRNA(fMet)-specific endonuclease VapC|uniref:Ribonuclease VapC n=1 Tax=Candidatus Thiodictyon syntrophicum TaxID=1166950 RepID=A0A2K8UF17_9GAMM|nr:PIN domain-containing protein [Candidatus Thiodictyon syntrophicum]AUB84168.1 VapC toxin family PIN domain ribonuclease [Candidatus Thiodictyon syntrophicum]